MSLPLQARYMQIEWREYGHARKITVAPEPIEIEDLNNGYLVAETQVFQGLCPWVGLRLEREFAEIQPAFEGADGNLTPMLQLDDGQGGHWWVQNDGWDPDGKRHLSELHRSMGQFTVVIGPHRLLLNNVVNKLSRVAIEDYLRDFQHDLIWLVMGFGGASAAGNGVIINREMTEALEAFAAASLRVLEHPASHMRETQIESRPARIRPNMATFRQYLRTPHAQRLPGRGAEATSDIADNRYLHHMIEVCQKLASSLTRSVEQHAKRFLERAIIEADHAMTYQSMTHRKVDSDVFDRQLTDLKKKLEQVSAYCDADPEEGEAVRRLEFRAGNPYGQQSDQIFFNNKDGSKAEGEHNGTKYRFSVLRAPEPLLKAIRTTQSFCDYYMLEGQARARWEYTTRGDPYRGVHFLKIYAAKPFTNAITRKEAKRKQLESSNWLVQLTRKEREENHQEALTAKLRGQVYRQYGQQAEMALSTLEKCQLELQTQSLQWKKKGVISSAAIPMGVRFSQSPNYTACQIAFSKIIQLAQRGGLSIEELDSIDRIGILHASALYERWCLVKILSVLMEDFHFRPESGWQERLVRAIAGRPESLKLRLFREDVGLAAILEVQPELPNGRRPDFRLRFSYVASKSASADENRGAFSLHKTSESSKTIGGLIMDAKFRTQWQRGSLGRMLSSLVDEKEYGQEGDRVFILHPAAHSILRPTSPLAWGKDCDYGQDAGKKHTQGVVYLAPGAGEAGPESNLRRLIAMQLQLMLPKPVKDESNENGVCESRSFCIRCGKVHGPQDVKQRITQRGKPFWTLSCSECGMQTTRTHCYGCDSGVLFKNGLNLTYHRTVADQVTNIVCPECGTYFDSEVHGRGQDT